MLKVNHLWVSTLLLLMFVAGCATMQLDTLNKKITAVEVSYGVILDKLQLYKDEGRFTVAQKATLDARVQEMEVALQSVQIAKGAGDLATAEGQLQAANTILGMLRAYVIAQENKQ